MLGSGVSARFFLIIISVLHSSRRLRACHLRESAYSLGCSFLVFILAFLLEFVFFSLRFFLCISISSSFFPRRVNFFPSSMFLWVFCGLRRFCGRLFSVPHLSDTCVRGSHFCFIGGVDVLQLIRRTCIFICIYIYIFYIYIYIVLLFLTVCDRGRISISLG